MVLIHVCLQVSCKTPLDFYSIGFVSMTNNSCKLCISQLFNSVKEKYFPSSEVSILLL